MGIPPVRRLRTARTGFTLIELVLVVALLLLLAGAAALNFDSLQRGAALDEGVGQLESLFRYARAQAEATGRQVRVVFGPWSGSSAAGGAGGTNAAPSSPGEAGNAPPEPVVTDTDSGPGPELHLLWEPDPVRAPGRFVALPEAAGFTGRLHELVRFRRALDPLTSTNGPPIGEMGQGGTDRFSGTNGMVAGPLATGEMDPAGLRPIAFFPDGSSESAELEVYSLDPSDARVFRVSLAGITGTFRRRLVPSPGAEWMEAQMAQDDSSVGDTAAGTRPNP